jgi:DNA-binding response OmpR family regulator
MRTLIYHPAPSIKAKSLQRVLNQCGIHTDTCNSSEHFLYLSMTERYSAVIVHELSEREEMLQLFKEWKKSGCTSLFVTLSSVPSALRRGQALAAGVDRYYIEPYSHVSLVKDIALHAYSLAGKERTVHATNHFEVDILKRSISFASQALDLTRKEFDILSLLLRKKGSVLSRVQIWEEVWGYEDYPLANTIDVHVNRLRKKLPVPARRFLNTVYGVGYRIHVDA